MRLNQRSACWSAWFSLVALLVVPTRAFSQTNQSMAVRQWTINGEAREATLFIPADAKEKAAPIVFAFHGHGGNMRNSARSFHIHTLWPEAICVYMQGLNTPGRLTDPEGKKPGWQSTAGAQGDRDLKFFDEVLATLSMEYKVDDARIFSTGHSNGAGFTYLLWAERGDKFAAMAPSASAATRTRETLKPKPVLHIAGRNDPLVKFSWQEKTIEGLRELNECNSTPKKWADGKCEIYTSKRNAPVVTMIDDGDHKFRADAPQAIVNFFKHYNEINQ